MTGLLTKTGVFIGIVILFITLFSFILNIDIFDINIGAGTGAFLVMIFSTYHNWRYFSQLDDEEMKTLGSIWRITHWLIMVWLASSLFLAANFDVGSLTVTFVGLIIGIFNVWFPRIARQEWLKESQEPSNLRDKFQQLRKQHYEIVGEVTPDWQQLESERRFDPDRIMELKLAEARTIYTLKKFIEIETRFADSISFLVSAIIVFLIPIVQGLIVEILRTYF